MEIKEITEEEIFNKVTDMISEHFSIDRDKITKDLNFQNDLDADSIDFVELVMDLEDILGTGTPDDDAEKLQTIGEAVECTKSHQN